MTISLILLIAAFVLFMLAAFNVPFTRLNLTAAGLALWVLSQLLGHVVR